MEKPEHHIFVCMSFRGLEPKGKCIRKNAGELLGYLEGELERAREAFLEAGGILCENPSPPALPEIIRLLLPDGEVYNGGEK